MTVYSVINSGNYLMNVFLPMFVEVLQATLSDGVQHKNFLTVCKTLDNIPRFNKIPFITVEHILAKHCITPIFDLILLYSTFQEERI